MPTRPIRQALPIKMLFPLLLTTPRPRSDHIPPIPPLFLRIPHQATTIRTVPFNPPLLLLTPHSNLTLERLRHRNHPRRSLIPRYRVFCCGFPLATSNVKGPDQVADQREEFALREFDSWAGAVAVAEAPVVVEVGEFGQRFFVGGGVGGVEPAVGEKFVAGGVCGFFAGDEARGGMLVSICVCMCARAYSKESEGG